MALYSWFVAAKRKINKNSKFIGKESKELTIRDKYLESYTMWPIAKVIQGEQVTPPIKKSQNTQLNEKALFNSESKTSLCTVLTVKDTKKSGISFPILIYKVIKSCLVKSLPVYTVYLPISQTV